MTVQLLVNIDVDDLDRAVAFYCEAFGLTAGRRLGRDAVELSGANAPVYLLAKQEGTRASPAAEQTRSYRRHWTPMHLDFAVHDLESSLARAERAGAVREGGIETHAWGRIAYLSDPFGNGFDLIEFLGRGYDEIAE